MPHSTITYWCVSPRCVGRIQVCLLCQLAVLLNREQGCCFKKLTLALRNTEKAENRVSLWLAGAAADRCAGGRRCVGVVPSETSRPLCLCLCQSWGRHADHVGREAAEGNAHSAEPDRRSAGFWSEPQPHSDQYCPLTWNPFYQITFELLITLCLSGQVQPKDLNNGVINACFLLLFKDLIKLYACYNDGIINLLGKSILVKSVSRIPQIESHVLPPLPSRKILPDEEKPV